MKEKRKEKKAVKSWLSFQVTFCSRFRDHNESSYCFDLLVPLIYFHGFYNNEEPEAH